MSSSEFNARFDAFLDSWGFRCSGELMLTMPTFQDEPERVVELIQAYLTTDAASPAAILARQAQDRIAETRRLQRLLGSRWVVVGLILRWTQKAILLRERARLKQALLYTRLRHIAIAMGDQLVGCEPVGTPGGHLLPHCRRDRRIAVRRRDVPGSTPSAG